MEQLLLLQETKISEILAGYMYLDWRQAEGLAKDGFFYDLPSHRRRSANLLQHRGYLVD